MGTNCVSTSGGSTSTGFSTGVSQTPPPAPAAPSIFSTNEAPEVNGTLASFSILA